MCLIFECHPSRLLFLWIELALTSFYPGWRDGRCGSLGGQIPRNHVLPAHLSLPISSSLCPEELPRLPRKRPPLQIICLKTYVTSNICCSFVFPRIYTSAVFMFSFFMYYLYNIVFNRKMKPTDKIILIENPPRKVLHML